MSLDAANTYLQETKLVEEMLLGEIYAMYGQITWAQTNYMKSENSSSACRSIFIGHGFVACVLRHKKMTYQLRVFMWHASASSTRYCLVQVSSLDTSTDQFTRVREGTYLSAGHCSDRCPWCRS